MHAHVFMPPESHKFWRTTGPILTKFVYLNSNDEQEGFPEFEISWSIGQGIYLFVLNNDSAHNYV